MAKLRLTPTLEELQKAMEQHAKLAAAVDAVTPTYLETLFAGITLPENEVFLIGSGFNFSLRSQAVVAFRLWQGKSFEALIDSMRDSIDDEIKHDGPDVMNLLGVLNSVAEHEALIKQVAKEMSERMLAAKKAVEAFEGKELPIDPVELFKLIFDLG